MGKLIGNFGMSDSIDLPSSQQHPLRSFGDHAAEVARGQTLRRLPRVGLSRNSNLAVAK
jgi:hypothetical protein